MPLIILRKVNKAVKALDKLEAAHNNFEESINELNEAELKEFTRISGASLFPKSIMNYSALSRVIGYGLLLKRWSR
jgi:DNA integrity scanning protein DisA with diadenylate cyclase activity